jgi:hypothetical protein
VNADDEIRTDPKPADMEVDVDLVPHLLLQLFLETATMILFGLPSINVLLGSRSRSTRWVIGMCMFGSVVRRSRLRGSIGRCSLMSPGSSHDHSRCSDR